MTFQAPTATGEDAGWATVPNLLTIARLVLLVPACWLLYRGVHGWWPLTIVLVWAGTDWVDGVLARRLHQVSRFGEVLDPVADRLGIALVALALAAAGDLPWWVPAVVLVTDAGVAALAGRAASRGDIRVTQLGRLRTALMFTGLVWLVAAASGLGPHPDWPRRLLALGAVLHVVAGADYIRRSRAVRA